MNRTIRRTFSRLSNIFRSSGLKCLEARIDHLSKEYYQQKKLITVLANQCKYNQGDSVGMNGQIERKKIIFSLFEIFSFQAVVETGTFYGETTGYFATAFKVPVTTSECIGTHYEFARSYLSEIKNITLHYSDSREMLNLLVQNTDLEIPTIFYLDAHWYEDLPLCEELEIIADNWKRFVIIVDDFKHPNDAGYNFDDYGNGKCITEEYISTVLKKSELNIFYPSAHSSIETGRKRGAAIICPNHLTDLLKNTSLLRQ